MIVKCREKIGQIDRKMDFIPTLNLFIIYVYVHGHIYCIYVHLCIIMHTFMYVYR